LSLGGNIQVSGAGGLPSIYLAQNKAWTTAGATDTIVLTSVLPAGTYLPAVSWTAGNIALATGILSAPAPTAGSGTAGSPLQIGCSSSVAVGTTYSYVLYKLT
jgi:hypothetical protein